MCPLESKEDCKALCSKAAAINSYNERGRIFNVPFRAPPIQDLGTGTIDEAAWAALGTSFSLSPWAAASRGYESAGSQAPLPSMASVPVNCPRTDSLAGTFYGWDQVPNGLWRQSFVPGADQEFSRAIDLNQAMTGYLVDPVTQLTEDGPLSAQKPTSGNSASYLPQAQPFAGVGFNLPHHVPRRGVANVRGVPDRLQSSTNSSVGGARLANLSG
jgi:hypothetical protein